jgi:hypothetical protein
LGSGSSSQFFQGLGFSGEDSSRAVTTFRLSGTAVGWAFAQEIRILPVALDSNPAHASLDSKFVHASLDLNLHFTTAADSNSNCLSPAAADLNCVLRMI